LCDKKEVSLVVWIGAKDHFNRTWSYQGSFDKQEWFYSKSEIQNRFVIEVLGKGLVTTTGEEWALHRQIVNPAFHQEKLKV
jgi:cytochrome P450